MATIRDALALVFSSKGKIMTVEFRKRTDKQMRRMNCIFGAHKEVKGVGMAYDPFERGLLPVWDLKKKDWRNIACEGIVEVRALGRSVKVDAA